MRKSEKSYAKVIRRTFLSNDVYNSIIPHTTVSKHITCGSWGRFTAASYTSSMAAVTTVDRMTSLSPQVYRLLLSAMTEFGGLYGVTE